MKVNPLLSNIDNKNFVNQYLSALGIDDVNRYLCPDVRCKDNPELYININEACYMLHEYIENGKKVAILCDSDADGSFSATIMFKFLTKLNIKPHMIFHKINKAHGITYGSTKEDGVLDYVFDNKIDLLIIPDASCDADGAKELKQNGVDCICLDHHAYDFSSNPYAVIVNCLQQDTTNQHASGTLVTDKFIERYCQIYNIVKPNYDDLVASSIITDVMDLTAFENRWYVNNWLKEWANRDE